MLKLRIFKFAHRKVALEFLNENNSFIYHLLEISYQFINIK